MTTEARAFLLSLYIAAIHRISTTVITVAVNCIISANALIAKQKGVTETQNSKQLNTGITDYKGEQHD